MRMNPRSLWLALALAGSAQLSVMADDWPQWRGPNRTGVSQEQGLLKAWPANGPKVGWQSDQAGLGYGSPAVVGGKVYIVGANGEKELLFCLDEKSGKPVWQAELGALYENGWGDGPRATPTVSGGQVYVMGGQGGLVCADAATGKVAWKASMLELGGNVPDWGYTESVLIDNNRVICTPGGKEGALAALDTRTGKVLWRSKSFTDGAQYPSPIAVDHNGARQYIQLTMKNLVGVDAASGKVLWKSPWTGEVAVIPTPIFSKGHVYIASGYGVGCKLVKLNPGHKPEDVYVNKVMKNHHGGVVLVGDHLYGHSDGGGWVCQNFLTGKEVWSERQKLRKGAISSAGGQLYLLEEDSGTCVLIDATPTGWVEHGRVKLSPQSEKRNPQGRIWAHPVIANGKLYLRDQEHLVAYDIAAK